MSESQRADQRIDVGARVEAVLCHGGTRPPIAVKNLSRSGAALMAGAPIGTVPEAVELRMRSTAAGDWHRYGGQLRYILGENRPGGEPSWLHGVRFTDVDEPAGRFLEELIGT